MTEFKIDTVFTKVEHFVTEHDLIKPHSKLIVGLSGGPDSVFLLYFLSYLSKKYNLKLIAAHLDHQWRDNSYADLIFCKKLANTLNITFESAQASEIKITRKTKGSLEEKGRLLRRTFFQELLEDYNANTIALGHHLNDQEETFFIRLIRGASLTGLASIWPKRGCYIHPLLSLTKAEILEYLDIYNLKYIEDPTNISHIYLRNKIRATVIPTLREADSRFDKNFEKAIKSIQESELFIEKITQNIFDEITFLQDNKLWLDINKFFACDNFLHIRLLMLFLCKLNVKFTPTQQLFKEIIRFLKQKQSKSHNIYPEWSLIKKKNLITAA